MNIISVQDDAELIESANTWTEASLSNQKILQLPAGNTPMALYRSWEASRPDFLNGVMFQQVDDVLTGPKSGCFRSFFKEQLPSYQKQFMSLSDNPLEPGLAILGVGINGHLAFHEPEINMSLNYGCVQLSDSTCASLGVTGPTWGLTYGAGHFIRCKALLIIAKGKNKKAVLETALTETEPTSPLSYILKSHSNCTLIIDRI